MTMLPYVFDDGGRADAGFRGDTDDCVTRAIAIAADEPYATIYEALHDRALNNRRYMAALESRYGQHARRHASPRTGVNRRIYEPLLFDLGFAWTPVMRIGSGCTVHLTDELFNHAFGDAQPAVMHGDRFVVSLSKHITAVVDGVIHDNHDPSRDGTRCVYGYYRKEG